MIQATWTDVLTIFTAKTIETINWQYYLESYQQGERTDIRPPYAVIRWGEDVPDDDWGLQGRTYRGGLDIYYVLPTDIADTTTTTTGTGTTKVLASTTYAKPGRRVYFRTSDVYAVITSVGGGAVVLDQAVDTVSGETASIEYSSIIDERMELLAQTFRTYSFSYGQLIEDPRITTETDSEPNQFFFSTGFPVMCGQLSVDMLYGEYTP